MKQSRTLYTVAAALFTFILALFAFGCTASGTGSSGYAVKFTRDDHVRVIVYQTQDMSEEGEQTTSTVSRDGSTGQAVRNGTGQVNFRLEFDEGYTLASIRVSGEYGNLKGPADTGMVNAYRVTKISSVVTISVTSKTEGEAEDPSSAYRVSFNTDEHVSVKVFNTQNMATGGVIADEAYARSGATGALMTDGSGQVNFVLVFEAGYELADLKVTPGNYRDVLTPAETKVANGYRIRMISSALGVSVTSQVIGSVDDPTQGYKADFNTDEHVKVIVYKTQNYSGGVESNVAYSREATTGKITKTEGQINFSLVFDEGYALGQLIIDGAYKNYKKPTDPGMQEGQYRITKIASDLSVTITSKEESSADEGFAVVFNADEHVTITVFPTQDLEDGEETYSAVSRDATSGAPLSDGDGQVNFMLTFGEGYGIGDITVSAGYGSLKGPSETGVDNCYRITKITANLTVTITSVVASGDESDLAYKVTFSHDMQTDVYIYPSNNYATTPEQSDIAYSRVGSTGELIKDGSGQVHFRLVCAEGYEIDEANGGILITGAYGALQNYIYTGVKGIYRITDVGSDLTVVVRSSKIGGEGGGEEPPEGGDIMVSNGVYTVKSHHENVEYTLTASPVLSTDVFTATLDNGILRFTCPTKCEILLSGEYYGGIEVEGAQGANVTLSLSGCTLNSYNACPINFLSCNNASVSAKNGTTNFIYDHRPDVSDANVISSAVYAAADMEIKGKGELTVVSDAGNGIHTKDDLEVKNLTLTVECEDNALKGNDSVTITSGNITLIARSGDGIKTTNSDLSKNLVQRGNITVIAGTLNVFSARDAIEAACDVIIGTPSSSPSVTIRTDSYSEYSDYTTATADGVYYVSCKNNSYKYSIYYYNNDDTAGVWKNSAAEPIVGKAGKSEYYYYATPKAEGYAYMRVYVYNSSQAQGQSTSFVAVSDKTTLHPVYDTVRYGQNNGKFSFTNYATQNRLGEIDPNGGENTSMAIHAANAVYIDGGTVDIKSFDDAIHADSGTVLASGLVTVGNVEITGGQVTIETGDDAIHADNEVNVSGGTVRISSCYEGLEGVYVIVGGGEVSIYACDDGINATAAGVTDDYPYAVSLTGGKLFVYAHGDGIDTNIKTKYKGILFGGTQAVIFTTRNGDISIDTAAGYTYSAGSVLAISPSSSGFWSETYDCAGFGAIGKYNTSIGPSDSGKILFASVGGEIKLAYKLPISGSFGAVYLGSPSATFGYTETAMLVDDDGVYRT